MPPGVFLPRTYSMRKADEVAVECAARRHRGCSHGQCGRREAIVLRPDNSRDLDALRSRQVTPPGDHLGFIQVRSPKNARADDRLSLLCISVHRVFYADYDTSSPSSSLSGLTETFRSLDE